ncbi:transcription-repair coupling factor [Stagnimonas aquatica]|uniref:Transcription-repair-coupling factor n=1 Tax=Stagnimonas aquatica TaxID=2689987 RepID=A0A3N0UZZ8_9GAMM|nr:transcription-repair coupling factor [Stagnimonas aquatica]ROH85942.1 transcription-repair coupling factor [Stagnimonas aquatica]
MALPTLPTLPASTTALRSLPPGAQALAVASRVQQYQGLVVAVAGDEQQAYRLEAELRFFLGKDWPVVHLQDTETLPFDPYSPHQEILSERLAALHRLPDTHRGALIVTADALLQRLPPVAWLQGRSFFLKTGQKLNPHSLRERLVSAGYQSVSQVQSQGEFALRGSLLDLFPMGSASAYRLDWFDDEIEAIRSFDPETQRSQDKVPEVRLLPAREFPTDKDGIETFRRNYREYFPGDLSRSRVYAEVSKNLMPGGIEAYLPLFFPGRETAVLADYLPANALWLVLDDLDARLEADWKQIVERRDRYDGNLERPLMAAGDVFLNPTQARAQLQYYPLERVGIAPGGSYPVEALPAGPEAVKALLANPDERLLFVAESAGRREAVMHWLKPLGVAPRLHETFEQFLSDRNKVGLVLGPIQEGLRLPGACIVAEAQIFGLTAPQAQLKRRQRARDPETILRDLSSLTIDSPVVHVEHGVGRYKGLQTLDAGGVANEYLVLEYSGGDKLYVPVGSLSLIHRYTGAEEQVAPLHSLGNERWEKAQAKAREKAHDVAAELLKIQARRAAKPGLKLDLSDEDYQAFIGQFPFTTTPDQQSAIDAVLADLQLEKPMDRVVCGDVGFGKTEVALRATFAVARAGRQVCVLAPTTLLAEQHAKNFSDRFAGWPIRVAALSRLRTTKEQNAALKQLEEGSLDVVIGTHRLLQPDIKFKDLGLVVVDEEHRFGVRHKERLKNLRAEVDLLTLTATPIPRTLNMSLAGLRDLSIIATPPPSRQAIKTTVAEWDNGLVYEACLRELKRGGQIYFMHNEVKDIEVFAAKIQELVPEGKVRFAHGQMRERELEQVMLDFYHNRFNILVCTTIIESGIDVPSANTILIDRADSLGLAQLHQLRGRVGRSHHRAYAYLLVPSKRALTPDAEKRLSAIETLGELGSGFALATHDLEIRGAGELLGDEQSGQIEEVGFTLYSELLGRAVRAIQKGKLDDEPFGHAACEVDLGVSALIPSDYVPDIATRLALYKRVAEASSEDALRELQVEFIDRFGLLPPAAERLFDQARLRTLAEPLGIRKLRAHAKGAVLEFGPQPKLDPTKLIALIQKQPKVYKLEGQKKLHISAELAAIDLRVDSLSKLLATLSG